MGAVEFIDTPTLQQTFADIKAFYDYTKIKIFKITSNKYRNRRKRFGLRIALICGIINYEDRLEIMPIIWFGLCSQILNTLIYPIILRRCIYMDFFEIVKQRYSHKEDFLDSHPVPLADLEKIALAGTLAPSGVNRQSVHLILLTNRETIDALCEISPARGLKTAPAAIAVLTDRTVTPPNSVNFEKEDYSAAVENMLLAAVALGYASLWLDSPYWDEDKERRVREVLGAPDTYKLWSVLPIGKPDGLGSRREKRDFSERVSYNRYGKSAEDYGNDKA